MSEITVGAVIEFNGKYLLVQEGKKQCRGKWNIPSGHLECNESLLDAIKREVYEETNCDIEPSGVLYLGNIVSSTSQFVAIIFSAKLVTSDIKIDGKEIIDVKWLTFDEIVQMKNDLRIYQWVINAIKAYQDKNICGLDIIDVIKI